MTTIPSAQSKSELRHGALSRRDALEGEQRAAAARTIAARGLPIPLPANAIVAGYAAIRSELDPAPLMQSLAAQGAQLALPVMSGRDQPLLFRAWTATDALVRGPFGIREPPADAPEFVPDIMLVPLAAFDSAGHRIGYGAGFYDRTLAQLRASKPVIAVGIAFAIQEVDRIPAEPHDVMLDYVLTEDGIVGFRSL